MCILLISSFQNIVVFKTSSPVYLEKSQKICDVHSFEYEFSDSLLIRLASGCLGIFELIMKRPLK